MTKTLVVLSFFLLAGIPGCGQSISLAGHDARAVPDFVNRATIYQVWMRAFTPEGTLQATAARLPYIASLGASIVYLSPLQTHSMAGGAAKGWKLAGPYGVKDYAHIDPEYGTEADLKALVEQAHKLGLKVIMDEVFYHMAVDNELMQRPGFHQRTADGKPVLGQWGRPLLDFNNPQLREYLVNILLHWVRNDRVDGFRCDVAGRIPVSFWQEARAALDKVNPEVVMLAEAEAPDQQLRAFDISYNFSYLTLLRRVMAEGEPAHRIREGWEKQRTLWPRGARLLRSSDNHDQSRAMALLGEKGAYAASALNFTLDGIPFLYNGQEVGDNTATSYPERIPIRWFLGQATAAARQQEATLAKYRRLFALRREETALTAGELIWLDNSSPDSVVSFLRKKGEGDELLVLINLSNRRVPVTVDFASAGFTHFTDLLTGRPRGLAVSAAKLMCDPPLGAFEALLLKQTAGGRSEAR